MEFGIYSRNRLHTTVKNHTKARNVSLNLKETKSTHRDQRDKECSPIAYIELKLASNPIIEV